MTKNFKTISFNSLAVDAAEMMEQNKIFTLVVMNKKEYVGVITMHDLNRSKDFIIRDKAIFCISYFF